MFNSKLIAPLAAFLGICVVLLLSRFLPLHPKPNFKKYRAIGQIESVAGEVESRLPHQAVVTFLTQPRAYFAEEMLSTHNDSTVVLALNNSARIKIPSDSRVVSEADPQDPSQISLTILSGTLEIETAGEPGKLRLFRNGKQLSGKELNQIDRPIINLTGQPALGPTPMTGLQTPPLVLLVPPEKNEPPIVATQPQETSTLPAPSKPVNKGATTGGALSNEEIVRTLQKQSSFVQNCYLGLLKRNPGVAPSKLNGTIYLWFTIQPNGKVTDTQVHRSPFKDQTLDHCLIEVIERTLFRPFRADAIRVTDFPIELK